MCGSNIWKTVPIFGLFFLTELTFHHINLTKDGGMQIYEFFRANTKGTKYQKKTSLPFKAGPFIIFEVKLMITR